MNYRDHHKSRPRVGLYSHVLAYAIGLHFVLGSVSVLNALEVSFFYYFPRTIQIVIIDPVADLFVWLVSVACASIMAIWPWKSKLRSALQAGIVVITLVFISALLLNPQRGLLQKTIVCALFTVATANFISIAHRSEPTLQLRPSTFLSRVLIYSLIVLLAIEISSGVHYVVRAFDPVTSIGKLDAQVELQLSYASYGLLPWLYVAFLFSWAWIPFLSRLARRFSIFRSGSNAASKPLGGTPPAAHGHRSLWNLLGPIALVACAIAVFIGYYPYFQNPPWLVGTDAYWRYYDPLMRMNAQGVAGGFAQALEERHPLPLALLYAQQLALRATPFEVVRFAPVLLVLVLGLATCWFLAGKGKDAVFVFIVFMFSVFSVTTTVGMFSSIIANWMALVVWMLFFAYVAFRADKKMGAFDVLALLSMSTLILLIHPWTWGLFAASVLVFVFITVLQERRKGLGTAALLILVIGADVLLAFLSLTVLGGSEGWRVAEAIGLYMVPLRNPARLLVFWDVVIRLTQVWAAFFSPLSLAISILGVFYLYGPNVAARHRRLILAWILVSAIGSILVAPVGYNPSQPTRSESQIWRLLFLTPFQLTVPFGVALVRRFPGWLRGSKESLQSEGTDDPVRGVFLAVLFGAGFMLAFAPTSWRPVLILLLIPAMVLLGLTNYKGREEKLLSDIVLLLVLLVVFNYTTRAVAQLLIDPHNYRPR